MAEDDAGIDVCQVRSDIFDDHPAAAFRSAVSAGYIPVEILKTLLRSLLCQQSHNARSIVGANTVRASAGKAHEICLVTCLPLHDLLHLRDVFPEGLVAGIDLLKIMR